VNRLKQIGIDIKADFIPAHGSQSTNPEFDPGFVVGLANCIGHFENNSILNRNDKLLKNLGFQIKLLRFGRTEI